LQHKVNAFATQVLQYRKTKAKHKNKKIVFYLINHNATLAHKLLLALLFEWKREEKTRCNKQTSSALRSFM